MHKIALIFGLGLPALGLTGCANQQAMMGQPYGQPPQQQAPWSGMSSWAPSWPMQQTAMQAPGLVEEVGPTRALAALPPQAGSVISVGERRSTDGLEQTIIIGDGSSYSGQNRITVKMRWGGDEASRELMRRPTEYSIAQEIDEAFPQGSVQPTTAVVANADGPIGIASGRSGGANCLYAWQTLETQQSGSWFDDSRRIGTQVRVRLCSAHMNQQMLIQLVAGLQVAHAPRSGVASLNPFAQQPAWANQQPAAYTPVAMAPAGYGNAYPQQAMGGCDPAIAAAGVCPGAGMTGYRPPMVQAPMMPQTVVSQPPRMQWQTAAPAIIPRAAPPRPVTSVRRQVVAARPVMKSPPMVKVASTGVARLPVPTPQVERVVERIEPASTSFAAVPLPQ